MMPTYDMSWVIVSVCMAVLAAYTALGLAGRVADASKDVIAYWIVGSGMALGIGIWSRFFGNSHGGFEPGQHRSHAVKQP